MKTLLLLVCLPALTFAAEVSLEESVANSIQALVYDTVNEGEQQAHVVYESGQPAVSCKVSSAKESGKKWAFCKVLFELSYDEQKGERECNLLYSFVPGQLPQSLVADQAKEDECLEALGEEI